ncbi:hypothetical protein AVEN_88292-1 [Araneus ventricosus]|uniref:Uncharacterized protein n=1 Tax=Araneus ventricosus TaxID=182803 RepID=A0A4Y2VFZ2_ARAVE|nr:hypothetical protein AVEN_88292-1 [Araneus ventricosus]
MLNPMSLCMSASCQTLSNAFWISRKTAPVFCLLVKPSVMNSVTLTSWWEVERFGLKPNCSGQRILLSERDSINLLRMTCSAILLKDERREIGLYLYSLWHLTVEMSRSRTNGSKRTDRQSERPDPGRHFLNKSFVRELLCGPANYCADPVILVRELCDPVILVRELCDPVILVRELCGTCYSRGRRIER